MASPARLARSTLAPGAGQGKFKVVTTAARLPRVGRADQSIRAEARLPRTLKDQRRNEDGDEDDGFP
jgi:hypothetical protein